ncbi:DUF2344 domain-containing protein [bacterium]|nr:DUF2344 domain-containing protein [bacterium]
MPHPRTSAEACAWRCPCPPSCPRHTHPSSGLGRSAPMKCGAGSRSCETRCRAREWSFPGTMRMSPSLRRCSPAETGGSPTGSRRPGEVEPSLTRGPSASRFGGGSTPSSRRGSTERLWPLHRLRPRLHCLGHTSIPVSRPSSSAPSGTPRSQARPHLTARLKDAPAAASAGRLAPILYLWEGRAVGEHFHLRVLFPKAGRLRYLSHLEVARACERAARRAGLPYAVSAGFTPRMRIAFGPALPVGTAGEREYYDLVLTRFVPPAEACRALAASSVSELAPTQCAYVSGREKSLAAALTIALYDVTLEGGIPHEELERSLAALVKAGTLGVEHKGKQKVFDLADALPKEPEVTSHEDRPVVRLAVRMSDRGSLRPEVLIASALGRQVRTAVTRTDLLIEEEGVWRRPL